MSGTAPPLHDAVPAYASGSFQLGADLQRMLGCRDCGAFEGVVFYAARILEVLSGDAIERLAGGAAAHPALLRSTAFGNLMLLEQFGLLADADRAWANALRRFGNDCRHAAKPVGMLDADMALFFLAEWLSWYFCTYPLGPRLPALTRDGQPLRLTADPELDARARSVQSGSVAALEPLVRALREEGAAEVGAVFASVLAERLIDVHALDDAGSVLDSALECFPESIRLRQLRALRWSRAGRLPEAMDAVAVLEPARSADEETLGIAGGILKQTRRTLPASHRHYLRGWQLGRKKNSYLGINAATTALMLGRAAQAAELAGVVRALVRSRVEVVRAAGLAALAPLDFWECVTLAEAHLLCGERESADAHYRAAFQSQPGAHGKIAKAQGQARAICGLLGIGVESMPSLAPPAPPGSGG
jgi:hypothetical protein